MQNKPELILGLSILLSLSAETKKSLNKLDKPALEEIYDKYKANALQQALAIERVKDELHKERLK